MRVVFLSASTPSEEDGAALEWLRAQPDLVVVHADVETADATAAVCEAHVLWCHASDRVPTLSPEMARTIARRVEAGTGLLLSLLATPLVVPLGLEDQGPNDVSTLIWHDDADELWRDGFREWPDFPHVRGLQAWGRHPLFEGLSRGAYVWRATEGERVSAATYHRPRWPRSGRVVAVERAYVHLNAERAVAWEYAHGAGRVLCIGAHVHWRAIDCSHAPHRDRVALNALRFLGGREPTASAHWPDADAALAPLIEPAPEPVSFGAALPEVASPIALTSVARLDDPFTLAGRRALVIGGERSGIGEIWVHPLCLLSGGVELRIDEEIPAVRAVEVTPELIVRHLAVRGRLVEERLFVPVDVPAAVAEYRWRRTSLAKRELAPPRIELRFAMPLRLEWPIPAESLQPLRSAIVHHAEAAAVTLVGSDDRFRAYVQVEGEARCTLSDDAASPRLAVRGSLAQPLRLTWIGGVGGRTSIARAVRTISRSGMRALAARRAEHTARVRDEHLSLRSPSSSLDTALQWAKARLDAFIATAPGVGTGLMAGYGSSGPGWNASRPGYAWFFGRDACWSALALLATGAFAEARTVLEFLAAHQDITGKMPHEVTASGVVHYDAADATPLWLLLLGRYAGWTGDAGAVQSLWPQAMRALDFVRNTDRDGDGLPENTGVGHGWIEMGPLGGGAVTSYVAAIWIAALEGLVELALLVRDSSTATRCARDAERARAAFDTLLFDRELGRHALQRMPDGRLVSDLTALAAVPLALEVVDGRRGAFVLDALAAAPMSTPWGVRMLAADHPLYAPEGYHSGTVWPLYTGWMSLATFAAHRAEPAYRHLLANALLCYDRAKGAFDEVLHGDELRPAGVCSDQAWSAAMVVLPLVQGMLGARPDAPRRRLRLTPHWPREWTSAMVRRLRVGDAVLELEATEGCLVDGQPHHGVRYRLRAIPPGGLTVMLEHPVAGRSFERVLVDGEEVASVRCGTSECPHVRVTVWLVSPADVQFVGSRIGVG